MVQKTRKVKQTREGVMTIPELRRSFEHIEEYIEDKMSSRETKEKIIADFRKEWERVFNKELDKKSAEAFIEHTMVHKKSHRRRKTHKRRRGGADPLQGGPIDYTTRPGVYVQPAAIPPNAYGNILEYVSKGFWNPEPAQQYDPVPGQTRYPTTVPVGMGDNTVQKGGKRKTRGSKRLRKGTRRLRRGGAAPTLMQQTGAVLSQAFDRTIPSSSPPTMLQDAQDAWYGRPNLVSSDQVFRQARHLF